MDDLKEVHNIFTAQHRAIIDNMMMQDEKVMGMQNILIMFSFNNVKVERYHQGYLHREKTLE